MQDDFSQNPVIAYIFFFKRQHRAILKTGTHIESGCARVRTAIRGPLQARIRDFKTQDNIRFGLRQLRVINRNTDNSGISRAWRERNRNHTTNRWRFRPADHNRLHGWLATFRGEVRNPGDGVRRDCQFLQASILANDQLLRSIDHLEGSQGFEWTDIEWKGSDIGIALREIKHQKPIELD